MEKFEPPRQLPEFNDVPFDLAWSKIVFFLVWGTPKQMADKIPFGWPKAMRGEGHRNGTIRMALLSDIIVVESVMGKLVAIVVRIFDQLFKLLPFGTLFLEPRVLKKKSRHAADHPASSIETLDAVVNYRRNAIQRHIKHLQEYLKMNVFDTLPIDKGKAHQVANLSEVTV
jgi:hypothetical protein